MRLIGFDAHALRLAGFSDVDVLTAGYTAAELRDAGFTAEELRAVGLAESTLRVVGFHLEQQVNSTSPGSSVGRMAMLTLHVLCYYIPDGCLGCLV